MKQCVDCKYIQYATLYYEGIPPDCNAPASRKFLDPLVGSSPYLMRAEAMRSTTCGVDAKLFSPNVSARIISFFKGLK